MTGILPAAYTLAFLLLAACGDDDNGDRDTLLTGFSGFLIFCLVVWLVWRFVIKRRGV